MKSYSIRPIGLVLSASPAHNKLFRTSLGGVSLTGCIYVWYIEGASRNILVDSGVDAKSIADQGWHGKEVQSLDKGLGKLGLKPEDIDLVIQTHLHWDHTMLASRFTKAKFLVQKKELAWAGMDDPLWHSVLREWPRTADFEVIEGDYQVEDGIEVLFTPGHTPGGQSVSVNTSKGTAIIEGLCCIDENFDAKIAGNMKVIPPSLHIDVSQAYRSLLRIKESADIIIPIHETRFAFIDRIP